MRLRRGPALLLALLGLVGCGRQRPDSALIVVVDTLRADHLGLYGAERPTSPRLDRWARRGLVFERAYSTAPWTLPAMASLLTGQPPSRHGAGEKVGDGETSAFTALRPAIPTLAGTLAAAGWQTGAVVNNPFLHARYGLDRGFRLYDHVPGNRRVIQRADAVVDKALGWLREQGDARFLLVVHLFDPHLNYDAPAPFRDRFTGRASAGGERDVVLREVRRALERDEPVDLAFLERAYDEEVAFVDEQLGRLFAGLGDLGLDDRTLVIFTSDHGEEFGEHGNFEHGHATFDEVARVPLVVSGPGIEAGRTAVPVSILDVPATVLAALGVAAPAALPGRSLLAPPPVRRTLVVERPLYGPDERAAIRWPWKLVLQEGRRAALYDLEADPGERRDLAAEQPAVVERLRAELAAATSDGEPLAPAALDPEAAEQLRSLGYIE